MGTETKVVSVEANKIKTINPTSQDSFGPGGVEAQVGQINLRSPLVEQYANISRKAGEKAASQETTKDITATFFGNDKGFRFTYYTGADAKGGVVGQDNEQQSFTITQNTSTGNFLVARSGSYTADKCIAERLAITINNVPSGTPQYENVSFGISALNLALPTQMQTRPTEGSKCEIIGSGHKGTVLGEITFKDPQNPREQNASGAMAWYDGHPITNRSVASGPVFLATPPKEGSIFVTPTATSEDGLDFAGVVAVPDPKTGKKTIVENFGVETRKSTASNLVLTDYDYGKGTKGEVLIPQALSGNATFAFGQFSLPDGSRTSDVYIVDRKKLAERKPDAATVIGNAVVEGQLPFPEKNLLAADAKVSTASRRVLTTSRTLSADEDQNFPLMLGGAEEYSVTTPAAGTQKVSRGLFYYRNETQPGGYWSGTVPLLNVDAEKKTAFVPGPVNSMLSNGLMVGQGVTVDLTTGKPLSDRKEA